MSRRVVVMIECPNTGKSILTGMEMQESGFNNLPDFFRSLHCELCGRDHRWRKSDARLVTSPATHDLDPKINKPSQRVSREARRPVAATGLPPPKAMSYRFFLFDGEGHSVRLRMADCEDVAGLSTVAREILENEAPSICAIEAWDANQRICRVERERVGG